MKFLSWPSTLAALLLCASAHTATAQHVYRCTEGGKTVYSDRACSDSANAKRVNANANTIDHSEGRAQHERDTWRLEREREYWAQEHQRQSDVNQQVTADVRDEKERKDAFRQATTVLPGAKGLLRSQRERAASLAKTPQERAQVMSEATTAMPGARGGLTASQLDTASRLYQSRQGRPMPPPAPYQDPPPPMPQSAPEPPGQLVNCDPAGCWDTSGRRFNNAAGGNFHRSDGKFCTRAGPNVICN